MRHPVWNIAACTITAPPGDLVTENPRVSVSEGLSVSLASIAQWPGMQKRVAHSAADADPTLDRYGNVAREITPWCTEAIRRARPVGLRHELRYSLPPMDRTTPAELLDRQLNAWPVAECLGVNHVDPLFRVPFA
ncbi:MAG: hypothetical protein AAGA03_07515, partial [Planctomycetota bacterium]